MAGLAGQPRDVAVATARPWVLEALREAADVARELGVRLALEVTRPDPAEASPGRFRRPPR